MSSKVLILLLSLTLISCGKSKKDNPNSVVAVPLQGGIRVADLEQTLKYQVLETSEKLNVAIEISNANQCKRYEATFNKKDIDLTTKNDPPSYGSNGVRMIWKTPASSSSVPDRFEAQNQSLKYRHFVIDEKYTEYQSCKMGEMPSVLETTSQEINEYLASSSISEEVLKDRKFSEHLSRVLDLGSTHFSVKLSEDVRLSVKLTDDEIKVVGFSTLSPSIKSVIDYINKQKYLYETDLASVTSPSIPLLILNRDFFVNSERNFCAYTSLKNYLNDIKNKGIEDEQVIEETIINVLKSCEANYQEGATTNE